jgi:hypothetical protein
MRNREEHMPGDEILGVGAPVSFLQLDSLIVLGCAHQPFDSYRVHNILR